MTEPVALPLWHRSAAEARGVATSQIAIHTNTDVQHTARNPNTTCAGGRWRDPRDECVTSRSPVPEPPHELFAVDALPRFAVVIAAIVAAGRREEPDSLPTPPLAPDVSQSGLGATAPDTIGTCVRRTGGTRRLTERFGLWIWCQISSPKHRHAPCARWRPDPRPSCKRRRVYAADGVGSGNQSESSTADDPDPRCRMGRVGIALPRPPRVPASPGEQGTPPIDRALPRAHASSHDSTRSAPPLAAAVGQTQRRDSRTPAWLLSAAGGNTELA
jgi:hypothetical protein